MTASVQTIAFQGVDAVPVDVQVHLASSEIVADADIATALVWRGIGQS